MAEFKYYTNLFLRPVSNYKNLGIGSFISGNIIKNFSPAANPALYTISLFSLILILNIPILLKSTSFLFILSNFHHGPPKCWH